MPPGDPRPPDVVMVIRHAEKPLHTSGGAHGVDEAGQQDPHSLTVTGWVRAGGLVGLLAPAHGEPPPALRRPDTVYGSADAGGRSKRSVQTVSPVAARLGLVVITRFATGQERDLACELGGRSGATLVAWHHESIHEIARHLGTVEPPPPRHWPDDRFDVIWTFTRDRDRWRFAQVPQLLLPGDRPHPISPVPDVP